MDKVTELAKMIDHSILHPTFTDADLKRECEIAVKYNVASVCVKPYAVKQAADYIKGSDVLNCCVIGFPHGNSSTDVKVFETDLACKDGAVEIDMVVNIGKVLSEDWEYVKTDIGRVLDTVEEPRSVSRLDGRDAVSLNIRKQSGTNTVKVVDDVLACPIRCIPNSL